jgi:predicted HicB family RNase H-like nuclease
MSEQHTNSQNKISGKFQNRIKKEQAENQKKEEEEQAKTGKNSCIARKLKRALNSLALRKQSP